MKTERVFFILIIIILIMKYGFLMLGTSIMLVLVLSALCLIFFPGGIYFFSDQTFSRQKVWLSLLVGFMLASAPIGVLYKLMNWPGSGAMIMYPVVVGTAMLALVVALQLRNKDEALTGYYKKMMIRTIVVTSFVLLVWLVPYGTIIRIQFRDDPEIVRLKLLIHEHPENNAYREELDKYQDQKLREQIYKDTASH